MAFLDDDGLIYLWAKIKALFNRGVIGLSIDGKTITYRKGDGSTGTLTTQDTVYTHPSYTARTSGLYKITVNSLGHVTDVSAVTKADIVALGIPEVDTLYVHPTWTNDNVNKNGLYKITVDTYGHITALTPITDMATTGDINTAKNEVLSLAQAYADQKVASLYKYKGSVADESKLPTTGNTVGDVYNIEAASNYGSAGMNVVWTGTSWDALGSAYDVVSITNTQIDTICV